MGMPNEPGNSQTYAPEETYPQPAAPAAVDPALAPQGYQQPPAAQQGVPPTQPVPRGPRRSSGMKTAELARQLRTPETKEFFKTSEFALTILGGLILMIAAAAQSNFDAPQMWWLFTALLVAYILSRGIAKAGTSRDESDKR